MKVIFKEKVNGKIHHYKGGFFMKMLIDGSSFLFHFASDLVLVDKNND